MNAIEMSQRMAQVLRVECTTATAPASPTLQATMDTVPVVADIALCGVDSNVLKL